MERAKKPKGPAPKIEKSERLISFDEFFLGKPIRSEIKAAIRVNLDSNYKTLSQWNRLLKEQERKVEEA